MNIWLIHIGELLPGDGSVRDMRYGILADVLTARGHKVTRFAPTFNHYFKKQRYTRDTTLIVNPSYTIEFLYAPGYPRNISVQRLAFNQLLALAFTRRLRTTAHPDIILAGLPAPEMCDVAVRYGARHGVPVVIDVRDLWPDIFLSVLPEPLQPLGRIGLWPKFHTNRRIFRSVAGITAVSPSYLKWGLDNAGRPAGPDDVFFPLAYRPYPLTAEERRRQIEGLKAKGVDPTAKIYTYLGSFEATYDLETVIEAFRILQRKGVRDVQCVLCGKGSKLESLQRLAVGVDGIVFPGWVDQATIAALLEISHAGLCSYISGAPQSLPNKPFEYLSAGLPLVSSLTGDLEDLLKTHGCGVQYTAQQPQSLADALAALGGDVADYQRMRTRAAALFKEQFSAEEVYPRMAAYLERLAKRK